MVDVSVVLWKRGEDEDVGEEEEEVEVVIVRNDLVVVDRGR